MKQKYCLLALTGLLMASCSNENDPFGVVTQPSSEQLTFVFPGTAKGVVPYADVTASAAENELKTLDIYVFGEDTLGVSGTTGKMVLEGIFRSGVAAGGGTEGELGYALSTSGDSKTATISVGSGEKKSFYFVANGRDHSSLNDIRLHETDTATFKTKVSNKLQSHIACPMLMSAVKHIDKVSAVGATAQSIELIRRMARFDIQNNSVNTNFTIQKVVLENAPADVPLFEASAYAATDRLAKFPMIDFSLLAGSNAGMANSVFYMYPSDKTDDISLKLSGIISSNGNAQIVSVPLKNYKTPDTFLKIAPNNRYLVDVEETGAGEIIATLTVSEWIVGDTINMNTGYGTIKLTSTEAGFVNNTLPVAADAMAADATIQVAADSEWKLVVDPAYADWIEVEQVAAVAPEVMSKTFIVRTTMANPSSLSAREGVVMVQNIARPSVRQPLIVQQAAQDKAAARYIDLSGMGMNGNALLMSGAQSADVEVDVAASAEWTATKNTTATWFNIGEVVTKAAAASQTHTGSGSFSITAEANETDQERVDTVKITISGQENLVQSLIVRQSPRNLGTISVAIFGMTGDQVNVPAAGFAGNVCIVSVKATTEWTYEITEGQGWLTESVELKLAAGTFNGTFQLTGAANTTTEVRTAKMIVKNTLDANVKKEITFTQAAGQAPEPEPTPEPDPTPEVTIDDITAPEAIAVAGTDGTPVSVAVVCSGDSWTVSNDSEGDWLTTTQSGENIEITATAFADGVEVRTAIVTVKSGDVSKSFTVTQNFE